MSNECSDAKLNEISESYTSINLMNKSYTSINLMNKSYTSINELYLQWYMSGGLTGPRS